MAKELPYFKFEPSEWQNGNIQMCSESTQLYFINMCCTYWSKLGNLSKKLALFKCFNNNEELFNELIINEIILIDENEEISISFLDKQLGEFKIKKKIKAESGRKGGLNNGVRPEIERLVGNQLYILECWNNEERFYKMGITTSSISRRYSGKIQYQYKVVFQVFTDKFIEAEKYLCEALRNCEYTPLLNFAGKKECYLYSENQTIESIINNYFDFAKASLKRNDAIREDESKEDEIKVNKKFNFKKSLIDLGVDKNIVEQWLQVRKTKKAVNTEIAFQSIESELKLSSLSNNECIKICVEKSWSGFKAEWITNLQPTQQQIQITTKPKFNFGTDDE